MKKIISILLCLTVIIACVPMAFATGVNNVYYIDSVNGSDSNNGKSQSFPWKTVENVRGLSLNPGDKIFFKCDGIYTVNSLVLTCSGTKENPIVISSYGSGSKPLLTTSLRNDVLDLIDCSYVTVSNLEITAHNGGGIWINTKEKESCGIKLLNLTVHDIQNTKMNSRDDYSSATSARACVLVKTLAYPSKSVYSVNDLSVIDCEMYDCGNGVMLWAGSFTENSDSPWGENPVNVQMNYGKNNLIKNCYFHDMDAEAIIIGMAENTLVTNCRAIDCCQGVGMDENGNAKYYTAPVWYWGGYKSTVEYCEISGAKNFGDAMAVDFDSWTNNCTYQYIYSHDNVRFMCNNPYGEQGQHNNVVRYCLSVNDNGGRSAISCRDYEYGIKFYNNTLVNCHSIYLGHTKDATIVNNIFFCKKGCCVSGDGKMLKSNLNISHNCYYGGVMPYFDLFSMNTKPCFAGTDYSDPKSFMLAYNSPLIGAGVEVEDDIGRDFFGNRITKNNIGCYGGGGVNVKVKTENIIEKIIRLFSDAYYVVQADLNRNK